MSSELVDRQAIVDLTIAYCWALDTRSWDDLERVFTPTATADLGGTCAGIEAIKARVAVVLTPLDASQHSVSTHQVHIRGDHASSRCYLQAQHVKQAVAGGSTYMVGGHYDDELIRSDDGWRIAARTLTVTWTDGNPEILGI